ncbi:MAG: hypothetical protein GY725_18660 [bacterium]|nr:hypothetical protein [bacterium]
MTQRAFFAENRPILLRSALYIALVVGVSNLLVVEYVDREILSYARHAIAAGAGWVLNALGFAARVSGERVFLSSSAVQIVNSCTGIDVAVFLASAVLVFPASWGARVRGVLLSFAVVLVVNFLRVLTLCYFINSSTEMFDLTHLYIWPAFITLVCLGTLLYWIQTVAQPEVVSAEGDV